MIEIISILIFFIALSIHEASHALVAYKFGDPTAKLEGRMTLNPLAHIDLYGTILVPLILAFSGGPVFGWAKPVMIDPRNLTNYKKDNFFIALSGPISNLLAAILIAFVLKFIPQDTFTGAIMYIFILINITLAVFNLIPVPPLDGSKIWGLFLSDENYFTLEQMGPFILFALILFSYFSGNFLLNFVSIVTNRLLGILT